MNHRTTAVALLAALAAAALALAQPAADKAKPQPQPDKQPAQQPEKPQGEKPQAEKPTGEKPKDDGKSEKPEAAKLTIKVTSPTITHDTQMPKKYTVDGENISPPLKWENAPKGTQEFALVMFDPDARGFVHWLVYNIPASVTELPENLPHGEANATLTTPVTVTQGKNYFRGYIGYKGPAAGKGGGVHRYRFHVYALDKKLELKPGATKKELDEAMKGHIIAQGELIGNNER